MPEEKFDPKKIVTDAPGPQHSVKYIVYTEKDEFDDKRIFKDLKEEVEAGKIKGKENTTKVCFAGLHRLLEKNSNRILFKVNFKQRSTKKLHLTDEELKKWVNLCKHHGLMPKYVGQHFLDTGNFILKIKDFSSSKVYMILSAARYMQEYPETVRATLHLREQGLNFFLAFLAACRCTVSNYGHSIYKQSKNYAASSNPKQVTVNPKEALALKIYVEKGHKSDKESLLTYVKEKNSYSSGFKIHNILISIMGEMDWEKKDLKISTLFSKKIQDRLK